MSAMREYQAKYKGPEGWTPEQRGWALHAIFLLAITPPDQWRSAKELHAGFADFRQPAVPLITTSSNPARSRT